jgi:hypothetical protein
MSTRKKVGLLTFHNAVNYGAALQTYATQKYINELGHTCELIDYVNETRKKAYNMKSQIVEQIKSKDFKLAIKMLFGSILMELRQSNFDNFYKSFTKRTVKSYETFEEIKTINNDFDFFVVGSDQVWNPKNNGKDMAYLLAFVKDNVKKISYASSFGINKLPDDLVEAYKECFLSISFLSTREQIGVDIIKNLTQKEAKLVLDPVFLLSKEQWISLSLPQKKPSKKIFVYTNRNNQYEDLLSSTNLNTKGFKIHKISRFLKPKDFVDPNIKVDYYINPQEFISNILYSDLIITASFHCVAFSIILQKKFVVFLTGDKGKDERIENILRITGLESRIYNEYLTEKDLYKGIDYDKVQKKLQPYIKNSKDFLEGSFK